jgi:hypothetical protein
MIGVQNAAHRYSAGSRSQASANFRAGTGPCAAAHDALPLAWPSQRSAPGERDIVSAGAGPTPNLDEGGIIDVIGRRHHNELAC